MPTYLTGQSSRRGSPLLARRRAALEAGQPVIGERLPLARRLHALAERRPDPVAGVEPAEPHGPMLLRAVVAEQRAPARPAEQLREALVGLPRADVLLARGDPQRVLRQPRLRRRRRARAPLAARAVAVARAERRLDDLEANRPAEAAAGDGEEGHGRSVAPAAAQAGTRFGSGPRERAGELPARLDAELGEHLAQVPLHRAGAEEELRADLRVRQPVAGEVRDLALLGGQVVARGGGALAHLLARGQQLPLGAGSRPGGSRARWAACCEET